MGWEKQKIPVKKIQFSDTFRKWRHVTRIELEVLGNVTSVSLQNPFSDKM